VTRDAQDKKAMFTPVSNERISREIVDQIKAAMLEGRLAPGDRLLPERNLAEQFAVSRVTVRDALRILEADGLLQIRIGARGGAIVTVPGTSRVGEGIANMLLLSAVTAADVTEARMVFELGTIPLVCERANAADIAELLEICDRSDAALRDGTFEVGLSAEFHIRLGRCTHNPAIEMIIDSFRGPLLMSLQRAKEAAPEMGFVGAPEHRALVAAIAERDVERARRIMSEHLSRTATRLRSQKPAAQEQASTAAPPPSPAAASPADADRPEPWRRSS
jgi:GntR family transcriptional regulator, transcriptional repressor for pyruvate dehydrogenase complex